MYDGEASMGVSRDERTVLNVRILVVDDDSTCLMVVAGMLKLFGYGVATTQDPLKALSTLYKNPQKFDLILSDVHMPAMNGLQLQQHIKKEFNIPVILMSGDDKENTVMQGLKQGAKFFFLKPLKAHQLQNLWQFVVSQNKGKCVNDSVESSKDQGKSCMGMLVRNRNDDELHSLSLSKSEENLRLNNHNKRKSIIVQEDMQDDEAESKSVSTNSKKSKKLVWTTTLHNKFLDAINIIGIDKVVPKKILEYMNVPGLTREHVASHLQKYRMCLRQLEEMNNSMEDGKPFRSPNVAGSQILMNNTQANTNNSFIHLINNIGRPNVVYDRSSSFAKPFNILESSISGGQLSFNTNSTTGYNNHVVHDLSNKGDLGTATTQFVPSNMLSTTSNVNHQLQQSTLPYQTTFCVGESSGGYQVDGSSITNGYWDDLFLYDDELWNLDLPLPGENCGGLVFDNNGASLQDNSTFDNSSNIRQGINQVELRSLVINEPIAGNQVVVEQQDVNMSNLDDNIIPIPQQVRHAENNASGHIDQVTGPNGPSQEMPNFDMVVNGSPPSDYQDVAFLNLADLSLDDFEDLGAIFSSNDVNIRSNN